MEVARTAPGKDANLAAGRTSVFGRVGRSEDLDFLRGIHIGGAETGAVGASTNGRSAVIGNQALGRAGAVDIGWALAETERKTREVAAARAGYQISHEDRVAPIQLQAVDLFPAHELLNGCRFRLERCCRSRHGDYFACLSQGKRCIHLECRTRIELVVCALERFEAGGLDGYPVGSWRNVGDDVMAGLVRIGLPLETSHVAFCNRGIR